MNKKVAVLGTQFGDEAKGRITHHLSPHYKYIIRTSGSNNCGHVVYMDDKKYAFHYLPSADFRDNRINAFLGAGMVANPETLLEEILSFSKDFKDLGSRIIIDPNMFLVQDKHIEEDKLKNAHIGTTNKGVGPAFKSKVSRESIRFQDLIDSKEEVISKLLDAGVKFKTAYEMLGEFKSSDCLFEGAQGVLLDLNFGTYPYVTSCDCTISSIGASGFNSIKLNKVYGIAKGGYMTRVGNGPFPTEMFGAPAERLILDGKEFGSTTGRKRRVGYMDLPALKYACAMGGVTELILTKLDVLDNHESIKICVDYDKPIRGPKDFETAKPIYEEIKGWKNAKDFSVAVIALIDLVEKVTKCTVGKVSFGVGKDDIRDV